MNKLEFWDSLLENIEQCSPFVQFGMACMVINAIGLIPDKSKHHNTAFSNYVVLENHILNKAAKLSESNFIPNQKKASNQPKTNQPDEKIEANILYHLRCALFHETTLNPCFPENPKIKVISVRFVDQDSDLVVDTKEIDGKSVTCFILSIPRVIKNLKRVVDELKKSTGIKVDKLVFDTQKLKINIIDIKPQTPNLDATFFIDANIQEEATNDTYISFENIIFTSGSTIAPY